MDRTMDKDRLKDIQGIALHGVCSGRGCDDCNNTGTNYQVSTHDWILIRDELVGKIDRLTRELHVVINFKPDLVKQLPEALRDYIRKLETLCDPGGLVQENEALRVQNSELLNRV